MADMVNGNVRCLRTYKVHRELCTSPSDTGPSMAWTSMVSAKDSTTLRQSELPSKPLPRQLMALHNFIENAEKLAVVGGVLVALWTFRNQTRQVRISNSYLLLDTFTKDISQTELQLLESVVLNTYESSGAQQGCFVTYFQSKRLQHPISGLFNIEGRGLVVDGSLEFSPDYTGSHYAKADEAFLVLSPIRSLAEQLNIIAYETLKGQIEARVVHYKLGHYFESLGYLLEKAMAHNTSSCLHLQNRFPWLIKLRNILRKRGYPSLSFATRS